MIGLDKVQIEELYKCYKSPVYFISNYMWIEIKELMKIVPFELFDYQETILNWLIDGKNGLILKSRRVGASTIIAAFAAWMINFRRGVNILFISETEAKAKELLKKVKFNLNNLAYHDAQDIKLATDASWMLNPFVQNTLQHLSIGWFNDSGDLESVSEIKSLTTTQRSGAGESATMVFMDEFGFLPDQAETMRAARLTTTRGGQWFICSTPNGAGDVFHSLCLRAERGENESYEYLKVHYSDAGMDDDLIRNATEGMSDADIMQEMEMVFLASGDPVFNPIHLAACYKPPEEYPEIMERLNAYRNQVDSNLHYFCGVDTAVGKLSKKDSRRDYHSFTALTKDGIQAFSYHTKAEGLSTWAGAIETLQSVGKIFKEGTVSRLHREWPGYIQIEDNGPGHMTVYNHQTPEDGFSEMRSINTNAKTKGGLGGYIAQLVLAVESHSIIITDKFTYQCMSVYQRGTTPGTFSAPKGDYYDDPVISLALAYDALLKQGKLEFPWGSTSDDLQRAQSVGMVREEVPQLGPELQYQNGMNDRMSSLFDDGNNYIDVTSDMDINKLPIDFDLG